MLLQLLFFSIITYSSAYEAQSTENGKTSSYTISQIQEVHYHKDRMCPVTVPERTYRIKKCLKYKYVLNGKREKKIHARDRQKYDNNDNFQLPGTEDEMMSQPRREMAMVDNNDALLFRRYRDLGEGENKVNVLEDNFQLDQEHTKGGKSKSSSNNSNNINQKTSRRRLSREFRRKQYIAYKENEDDDEFNIRRISKRALASLKSIHNLADRASDQISSVGAARRQQILDELVRSGRLKVGEIDARRKILRVCTDYTTKNHTIYKTIYKCCPGYSGSQCQTEYLNESTISQMQQHLQKLDQNYQQIEIMKQELAEQKQRILDTEQSFLYQNYDEPIEPKFNEQQAYSPLSLQSPIQPIDLESQLDYDYQNYVGQYVDEDYVGSENFTLHSPIANVYNDMRENQFEEEGYDVDDDDDDENYNNEQGRDQDYDLRGDHRPRPHQKVQFTPKSNQNKIVPNQFNAELIAMLQEQFLIAHNKLEQENKQEREKMIEEITNLKNELTKKQKEFEKRTLELKRNEMIKVEPLSEDITANRLNTRTIIVPIVTNSSICRLDEKHDYNDYVDPRGYDEEHEESLEIIRKRHHLVHGTGHTILCKLPIECSHYFRHPYDCCPKCCPFTNSNIMYTKSNEVYDELQRCPGLEQFPDLCYHWENNEWYDDEQLKRNEIKCPKEPRCDTEVLESKDRLCCKTDCL